MTSRQGFTLIELLIVLIILSLTASFVGPVALRQVEKTRVLAEREKLSLALDYIRFEAFSNSILIRVEFDRQQLLASSNDEVLNLKFDILRFPRQLIEVNSHGFWQSSEVIWLEDDAQFKRQLNSEAIQ